MGEIKSPEPSLWFTNRRVLLPCMAVMVVLATIKFVMEYGNLLWMPGGGKDLVVVYNFVNQWFAGFNVYSGPKIIPYPPASMPVFWPLLGWVSLPEARWIWAFSCTVALAALVWMLVAGSGATSRLQRVFVAVLILAVNATSVAIGNGQSTLHILALTLGGILVLRRGQDSWLNAVAGAALLIPALYKPSLTVPFLWLTVFFPQGVRWRPIALVLSGYAALTWFALQFQHADILWLMKASTENGTRLGMYVADGNILYLLRHLGVPKLALPLATLLLGWLGWWMWRNRQADLWLLLGVTAIVARVWTYHRIYDDVVVVFASVALYRIAVQDARFQVQQRAAQLLGATLFVMLPLAFISYANVSVWFFRALIVAQTVIWLADLMFLLRYPAGIVPVETDSGFQDAGQSARSGL